MRVVKDRRLLFRTFKWESRLYNIRAGTCKDLTKAGSLSFILTVNPVLAQTNQTDKVSMHRTVTDTNTTCPTKV